MIVLSAAQKQWRFEELSDEICARIILAQPACFWDDFAYVGEIHIP